jgi:hypothetical protein
MKPVTFPEANRTWVTFPEANRTWAEHQPEYLPLPTWTNDTETISRWAFTWRERLAVLLGADVWVRLANYGAPLQAQALQLDEPFEAQPAPGLAPEPIAAAHRLLARWSWRHVGVVFSCACGRWLGGTGTRHAHDVHLAEERLAAANGNAYVAGRQVVERLRAIKDAAGLERMPVELALEFDSLLQQGKLLQDWDAAAQKAGPPQRRRGNGAER